MNIKRSMKKALARLTWGQKMAVAVVYDALDLMSLPIVGSLYDIIGVPLGYALWGPLGMAQAWEILDPTDVADRFVPTLTAIGLYQKYGGRLR